MMAFSPSAGSTSARSSAARAANWRPGARRILSSRSTMAFSFFFSSLRRRASTGSRTARVAGEPLVLGFAQRQVALQFAKLGPRGRFLWLAARRDGLEAVLRGVGQGRPAGQHALLHDLHREGDEVLLFRSGRGVRDLGAVPGDETEDLAILAETFRTAMPRTGSRGWKAGLGMPVSVGSMNLALHATHHAARNAALKNVVVRPQTWRPWARPARPTNGSCADSRCGAWPLGGVGSGNRRAGAGPRRVRSVA